MNKKRERKFSSKHIHIYTSLYVNVYVHAAYTLIKNTPKKKEND